MSMLNQSISAENLVQPSATPFNHSIHSCLVSVAIAAENLDEQAPGRKQTRTTDLLMFHIPKACQYGIKCIAMNGIAQ